MSGKGRQWEPVDERFNKRLAAGENGCIVWTGAKKPKGYGMIQDQGTKWVVTRWAWTRWVGPIPHGMIVRHKCDNPPCVRLAHLELGTVSDNSRDMYARGREHPRMRQGRPKLTPAERRAAVIAARDGTPTAVVAKEFGVSQRHVYTLLRRDLDRS